MVVPWQAWVEGGAVDSLIEGSGTIRHLIRGHPPNFKGASKHRPFYWEGTPL